MPRDTSPDKVYTFKERLDEYRVFCELARTYGVSIDFHDFAWHLGFDTYDLLARIAIEFPDVPIIFCHAGYSIGGYARGPELVRSAPARSPVSPSAAERATSTSRSAPGRRSTSSSQPATPTSP